MLTLTLPELFAAALMTATIALLTLALNVRSDRARRNFALASIVAGAAASFTLYQCYTGAADVWFDSVAQSRSNGAGKMLVLARDGRSGSGQAGRSGIGQSGTGATDSTGGSRSGSGDLPEEVEGSMGSSRWSSWFAGASAPAARKAKLKPFRDCPACPEMVPLEAGYAALGADDKDAEAELAERPQRIVRIGKPFAIGRYEVTVAEFEAYLKATGRTRACIRPTAAAPEQPIDCVTFGEARDYAAWLSAYTDQTYRLPSAGEWEYAARAGTATPYIGGWQLADKSANLGTKAMMPVGSYPANGFGLHDMSGNVAEWTADCWLGSMWKAPSDGSWVSAGADCRRRVVKDGAWPEDARHVRVSSRRPLAPATAMPGVGFRLVREMRLTN